MDRLPPEWFRRDALTVARDLIGKTLVHRRRSGVITETEAYIGPHDLACHARFGPTERTSVMFGPGGFAYVYLCYGVHEMFNIVTGPDGHGEAVLVRAVAIDGDDAAGRGPGKVTVALGIDRRHNRRDLARGALHVLDSPSTPPISTGPRIGVDYAGEWAKCPYRFWWTDHPSVSRQPKPRLTPRKRRAPAR